MSALAEDIDQVRDKYINKLYSMYEKYVVNKKYGATNKMHYVYHIDFCDLLKDPESQMKGKFAPYRYQCVFNREILERVKKFRFLKRACDQISARTFFVGSFEETTVSALYLNSGEPSSWVKRSSTKYPMEEVHKDKHPAYVMFCTKAGPYITFATYYSKGNRLHE